MAPGFARRLRVRLGWQRTAFTLLVCALVSTQAFFQPTLYTPFDVEGVVRTWLDYLGECLLMGVPIMLTATTAEVLLDDVRRGFALSLLALALLCGATVGALLLIPYYDAPTESAFNIQFVSDLVYWVLIASGIAAIYALQQRAAAAAAAAHQAQVDQIALSKQMLEAQLQVMRAQIEPHFLFNTLANVKRLTQTNVVGGVAMLDNLVRYLRAALPRMREESMTLGQEADLAQAYLEVLHIRMGERLRYTIDIPDELRAQPFPPMMVLTLVENAVKHGLNPSPDGGTLAIRAHRQGRNLMLSIADTGVGFAAAATGGSGVGLANTRARLAALHGEAAGLVLAPNEPSGVIAAIHIPYLGEAVSAAAALEYLDSE
jgi:sensor histidine kinase YesM